MLLRRLRLRALNGLQPLKEALTSVCWIFPQPVETHQQCLRYLADSHRFRSVARESRAKAPSFLKFAARSR
jgi:hypothetical protein